MNRIDEVITPDVKTLGIAGHVNPDGDCIGSCTALYLYVRKNFPEISVDLYLEEPKQVFKVLPGVADAKSEIEEEKIYDLFITCDVSDPARIGVAGILFSEAKHTVSIDHHVTNPGFAVINHVEADASSCAEVLTGLVDTDRIDQDIATLLYNGIIHDCGVFQYRNTTPRTMRMAAELLEKGVEFSDIIDQTFNQRSFKQNRILGYALEHSGLTADGKCAYTVVRLSDLEAYDVTIKDLDIIVPTLRYTQGVEAAAFVYETAPEVFKVSLRSNRSLDVAAVAGTFGGGGHIRAAGCTITGSAEAVLKKVLQAIEAAM